MNCETEGCKKPVEPDNVGRLCDYQKEEHDNGDPNRLFCNCCSLCRVICNNALIDEVEEKEKISKSCVDCHYSSNGKHGCNRLMYDVTPKIDISKGYECAHNEYVHYLKFKQ